MSQGKFLFYAFNFAGGQDTREAAKLYAETFGWEILRSSLGHSELRITEGVIIVFSRPSANCPVTPGTLTLVTASLARLSSEMNGRFFKEESSTSSETYISYLDPWDNRIWFYENKKGNS